MRIEERLDFTAFPVGMPADPSETSPHSSPYFLDLPHYNPVKVCPPHLHRSGSVFNNTALDPLDYTLTSLFSSALLLEVFEKEGPLVLESVRNAALTYLFNKVDKNWDSSSSSSQAMIKKTLNAVLSEKALWKQAVDQPVGSNAVPGALINARLQIVRFDLLRCDNSGLTNRSLSAFTSTATTHQRRITSNEPFQR